MENKRKISRRSTSEGLPQAPQRRSTGGLFSDTTRREALVRFRSPERIAAGPLDEIGIPPNPSTALPDGKERYVSVRLLYCRWVRVQGACPGRRGLKPRAAGRAGTSVFSKFLRRGGRWNDSCGRSIHFGAGAPKFYSPRIMSGLMVLNSCKNLAGR